MEQQNVSFEEVNPQVLLAWKAPLRAYKKRGKNVLRFFVTLALLLSVIIFFFGDPIVLIPIWALLFLFYVLTITPPPIVENKISRFGIETAGVTLRWEVLSHFYFLKRFNYEVLTTVTHGPYYLHSYMVIPNVEVKQQLIKILSEHIIYQQKPQRTYTDRMVDLLAHLIPDDDEPVMKKVEEKPVTPVQPDPPTFVQTPIPGSLLRQISDPT